MSTCVSEHVSGHLTAARSGCCGSLTEALESVLPLPPRPLDIMPAPCCADDAARALYLCYELHYRGMAGANDCWEWDPGLLALRARLEQDFLDRLFAMVGVPPVLRPADLEYAIRGLLGDGGAQRSLSAHMDRDGTRVQFREFAVHRSAYQLKEADPHTWAIPRIGAPAKIALATIQADEYGVGSGRDHASLFATTMDALGLDSRYGAYLDRLPAATLDTVNLISFFGLHRRWRGALVGHLTIFEMASVVPNQRYGDALRRLGFGPEATTFFDVHVTADAVHQDIALYDLALALARQEPALTGDILFGARAISAVEQRFTARLLAAWDRGESSLRGAPSQAP